MSDPITFPELSKGDQKRLRNLATILGVPFRFDSRKRVQSLLRNGQKFSNTEVVHHNGKLVFITGEDVQTICHDMAHALFLGPLYKRLKNGVSDLADIRWKAEEESSVMALQCFIADACLYDYGGRDQMVCCMESFGYGFGNRIHEDADWWIKTGIKKDAITAKDIPQYPELRVDDGNWDKAYFIATA